MSALRFAPVCLALASLVVPLISSAASIDAAEARKMLLSQGVGVSALLGGDAAGRPMTCGTESLQAAALPRRRDVPPPDVIGWEAIPGVIRFSADATFRLEVTTGLDAATVTMDSIGPAIVAPAKLPLTLRDNGVAPDREPNDGIYTAGPFGFDPTKHSFAANYLFDAESPSGIDLADVGNVRVSVHGGTTNEFLIPPKIGLLLAEMESVPVTKLSADVAVSANLVNVRSGDRETQRFMRHMIAGPTNVARALYEELPDIFDALVFFSSYRLELLPQVAAENFVAGIHTWAKTSYTGTGLGLIDLTGDYGSKGRLHGVNAVDAYDRGMVSKTFVHELLHQWACFLDPALGICDGAHYKPQSSAASLVGGFEWNADGDGTFTADCTEGRNGAHRASAIDRYLAGLLDASSLPPVRAYADFLSVLDKCDGEPITAGEIAAEVTASEIEERHGERLPGPPDAQRSFHLGFVVESVERLLSNTEMTFYEILAAHVTKPVPEQAPDPYLGFNWAPLGRFFGPGVAWTSEICLRDDDENGVCDESQCLRGDCNGNGIVDAGDSVCVVRCLLDEPLPGFDCSCAADCNCLSGLEAADSICAVLRLLGTFPTEVCGALP